MITESLPFDFQQIAAVLRLIVPNSVLQRVDRPNHGLTGNVYVLETRDCSFILRIFPENGMPDKPEKERIVYGLMRGQGIPVPMVLVTDLSKAVLPFGYALSEQLPGITLSEGYYNGMSVETKRQIYRQLGEYLGQMHSLTFAQFGDVTEENRTVRAGIVRELRDSSVPLPLEPFDTWVEMHRQIIRRHLTFLQNTVFGDMVEPLDCWFRERESLLSADIVPRLLHMDLHRSNILISGDRVTGILDVEESLIGHNEFDLMRTELAHFREGDTTLQEAFFNAYTAHVPLSEGYEDRKGFYELSRSLVGMRCLITFGNRYASDWDAEVAWVRATVLRLMYE